MQSNDKETIGFKHPKSAIACISLCYRKDDNIVSFSFPLDIISYTNKWAITNDEKSIIGDKIKEIILKRNKNTSPVILQMQNMIWLGYLIDLILIQNYM